MQKLIIIVEGTRRILTLIKGRKERGKETTNDIMHDKTMRKREIIFTEVTNCCAGHVEIS